MFYVMNDDKLAIYDDDREKLEITRSFMPQLEGQYTLETDIVTAEELDEHPNKVIVGDVEIEIDVPDEVEEDEEQAGTHKETITVKGLVINPDYEAEEAAKERERLDNLTLTPADVERALYKAKGMDFEDLKALIAEQAPQIDMKALAIEFRANLFYRGVVVGGMRLIDTVGALLGYTPADMDYLFEHKELPTNED